MRASAGKSTAKPSTDGRAAKKAAKKAAPAKAAARKAPAEKTSAKHPAKKAPAKKASAKRVAAKSGGAKSSRAVAVAAALAAQRAAGGPARPLSSGRARGTSGADYPALVSAARAAATEHGKIADPMERARALTRLIDAMLDVLSWVTADRDEVLLALMEGPPARSNRSLAAELGTARQGLDQLSRQARAGGRPRRP